jgi:class 3 adenylate cyclase
MLFTKRLSIRSKLVILLLLTSIVSIVIIAYQGYRSAKEALNEATYNQLKTLRSAKTQQIEAYFSNIHNQILGFADNRLVIESLNEFRTAYHLAGRESIEQDAVNRLESFYRKEFIPRLKERAGGEPETKHFLPKEGAAVYLQYHYIAENPLPVGEKAELIKGNNDGSYYAQVHERYHESLRALARQFGYYDLFLIDPETGDVIYSVSKETDFATNLIDGPNSSSGFAQMVRGIMQSKKRGDVRFQDFDLYAPSFGAPAAFVAVAVYDDTSLAGILALQVPTEELNNVMTSRQKWEENGMGESGEVYLVGRNHLMRSDSRFLLQKRDWYLQRLADIGIPPDTIAQVDKLNTTILFQPVNSDTVELALSGKSGTRETVDYRGIQVLSAYAPLRVEGLDWVIQSEMDIEEINKPINQFRHNVMVSASVLGTIITLLALLAASLFTRPIHKLVAALRRVGKGETDVQLEVHNDDEIGELTRSFNSMTQGISEQQTLIENKDLENTLLLHNILPEAIAERVKAGEENIVDRIPNVSVIFINTKGMTHSEDSEQPVDAIAVLNRYISEIDSAAENHGVDKIKTIGDDYIAACGLLLPRLDHSKRALEFADEALRIADRVSRDFKLDLSINIGIHSGTVLAGVIGTTRFAYDVWGRTVDIADELSRNHHQRSIRISEQTREQLHDPSMFREDTPLKTSSGEVLKTWLSQPGA